MSTTECQRIAAGLRWFHFPQPLRGLPRSPERWFLAAKAYRLLRHSYGRSTRDSAGFAKWVFTAEA